METTSNEKTHENSVSRENDKYIPDETYAYFSEITDKLLEPMKTVNFENNAVFKSLLDILRHKEKIKEPQKTEIKNNMETKSVNTSEDNELKDISGKVLSDDICHSILDGLSDDQWYDPSTGQWYDPSSNDSKETISASENEKPQKILNEEDRQLILDGLSDGHFYEMSPTNSKKTQLKRTKEYFDLNILNYTIHQRIKGLETICGIFAENLSKPLSRCSTFDITPISIDTIKFNSFRCSVPKPHCVLEFVDNYLNVFYLYIDHYTLKVFDQLYSSNDSIQSQNYSKYLCYKQISKTLNYAFSKKIPNWKCKLINEYDNIDYLPKKESDLITIASFEVDIDTKLGNIVLMLPYDMIHQFKKYLNEPQTLQKIKKEPNKKLIDYLLDTSIPISLKYKHQLNLSDVINLKIGQEIIFDDPSIYIENDIDNNVLCVIEPQNDLSYEVIESTIKRTHNNLLHENKSYYKIKEYFLPKPTNFFCGD